MGIVVVQNGFEGRRMLGVQQEEQRQSFVGEGRGVFTEQRNLFKVS